MLKCDYCKCEIDKPDRAVVLKGSDNDPWEIIACDNCLQQWADEDE